jgi:hypothetical protein
LLGGNAGERWRPVDTQRRTSTVHEFELRIGQLGRNGRSAFLLGIAGRITVHSAVLCDYGGNLVVTGGTDAKDGAQDRSRTAKFEELLAN